MEILIIFLLIIIIYLLWRLNSKSAEVAKPTIYSDCNNNKIQSREVEVTQEEYDAAVNEWIDAEFLQPWAMQPGWPGPDLESIPPYEEVMYNRKLLDTLLMAARSMKGSPGNPYQK